MVILYLALAASLSAPSDGASSDPAVEQIAQRIEFGDLDLGSSAGKAELSRRVRRAGAKVCDDGAGPKTQSDWRRIFTCKQRARLEASKAIERASAGTALATNSPGMPKL